MANWLKMRGVTGNLLMEIMSDVYLKLVTQLPKFVYDESKCFRAWLKRVVETAFLDSVRASMRCKDLPMENAALDLFHLDSDVSFNTDELVDELKNPFEERMQRARCVISRVKSRIASRTWDAFYLTEVEERSCAEVARDLGMKENQVYIARFRVRGYLREEAQFMGITETK